MKVSKSHIRSRAHTIPKLRFEQQRLTSYAGVVVFQRFFQSINLRQHLDSCFQSAALKPSSYGLRTVVMTLILHFILGNRRIRDLDYYSNDPMVMRVLGLKRMPNVSTISRTLTKADSADYENLKEYNRDIVHDRIRCEQLCRATIDFDGTVLSTRGRAEGTAVGFNKKRKGARSYYPLMATVAQTGQVLDWLDRTGNVHDSNGAPTFMRECFAEMRRRVPGVLLESRMDSAFFNDDIIEQMTQEQIQFTASVPFERFTELKNLIEERQRWRTLDDTWSFFEKQWKPKSWDTPYRFVFFRQRAKKIEKGPIQLDLFRPASFEFTYKVVVTNMKCSVQNILHFHNGRGTQEGIFAECKQHAAMDYIPFKRLIPNRIYFASSVIAHNLGREIQMNVKPRARTNTPHRSPLWVFESLGTLGRSLLQRAGRLTNRAGKLILSISAPKNIQNQILTYLEKSA